MIKLFLKIYLFPVTAFRRLYFYVLDIFFSPSGIHIERACFFIKNNGIIDSKIIIDVGCHERGFITNFLEKFKDSTVIGYEPNIKKFNIARFFFLKDARVTIKNLALGDVESTLLLNITKQDYSSSLLPINDLAEPNKDLFHVVDRQECKVVTLDEETRDLGNIMLIKIDTQGFELKILQGAINTLKKTQYVLIEMMNHQVYSGSAQYYDIDVVLRNSGFLLAQLYSPLSDATEFDALYKNVNYGH